MAHTLRVSFPSLSRPEFRRLVKTYRRLAPDFLAFASGREILFRFPTADERDRTRAGMEELFRRKGWSVEFFQEQESSNRLT